MPEAPFGREANILEIMGEKKLSSANVEEQGGDAEKVIFPRPPSATRLIFAGAIQEVRSRL